MVFGEVFILALVLYHQPFPPWFLPSCVKVSSATPSRVKRHTAFHYFQPKWTGLLRVLSICPLQRLRRGYRGSSSIFLGPRQKASWRCVGKRLVLSAMICRSSVSIPMCVLRDAPASWRPCTPSFFFFIFHATSKQPARRLPKRPR